MMPESLGGQLLTLVILAIPVACVTWTVIHEEMFREVREYFERKSRTARHVPARKFYYLFTCEYCFSHYVAILALVLTRFTLLVPGWRGYILAGFGLVWLANVYMGLFSAAAPRHQARGRGNRQGRAAARGNSAGPPPAARLTSRYVDGAKWVDGTEWKSGA